MFFAGFMVFFRRKENGMWLTAEGATFFPGDHQPNQSGKNDLPRNRFLESLFPQTEARMKTLRLTREDHFDKVMGCWLGKNAGGLEPIR